MSELKVLLGGLGIPESPRWHEGRLWFCNWIARQVMAVDMDGKAEVMLTRDPASHSMGYSIEWLPDGRLLTTGDKVRRQEPDGSMAGPCRAAGERDRRGRTRQRLRQRRGLRLRRRCAAQPRLHQARHAGWASAPGRRRYPVSQRHGHHPGRPHADHLRVVGEGSPRSTSTAMAGCRGGACSPRVWGRTASAWTPKARCGCPQAGSRSSASPRAARSCNASNSRRTGRRSR